MDLIPLPEAAIVCTLPQPGFATTAPELIYPELIPPFIRHAMDSAWTTRAFAPRPLRVAMLEDVFVTGEGLVFTSDLRCFEFSRSAYPDAEIERHRTALLARIAGATIPTVTADAVLCKKRGCYNYGHWMLEMLPRAIIADRFGLGLDPHVLVLAPGGGIERAMRRSLELAGLDPGRVIWTSQEPLFVRHLWVLDGLTAHGQYMSALAVGALDRLRRPMPGTPRPLYVQRGQAHWRQVLNEAEFSPALDAAGYAVCDPGRMPVEDQIAAFQDASSVIGLIGAGLTNIAFCRPGTPVTVFVPAGMPDTFFWFLAQHRGLPYREIRVSDACADPANTGFEAWDRNLRLPAGLLDLART